MILELAAGRDNEDGIATLADRTGLHPERQIDIPNTHNEAEATCVWATLGPQETQNDAKQCKTRCTRNTRSQAISGRIGKSANRVENPRNRPSKPVTRVRIPSGLPDEPLLR